MSIKKISIVGGTGALGSGLATRWVKAGYEIVIGSRDAGRAVEAAQKLAVKLDAPIVGMENSEAAAAGDIVVLTVPYENHQSTLETIQPFLEGKILVDVTVPLMPPKVRTVQMPEGGSAAKAAQTLLGKGVRVVSAFQNVAATHLADLDHVLGCDILVCGNDPEARNEVVELATKAGMKAWHAGRIDNSTVAEALTSTLIFINAHYKIDGAGINITGLPQSANSD
jgi:hypothetical protein